MLLVHCLLQRTQHSRPGHDAACIDSCLLAARALTRCSCCTHGPAPTRRNAPSVASTPASTALGRRAAQHQPPRAGAAVRRGAGRQLCAGWQHDFQRHGQRGSAARVLPHHAEAEAVPVASDDELAFYRVGGVADSWERMVWHQRVGAGEMRRRIGCVHAPSWLLVPSIGGHLAHRTAIC